MSRTDVGAISLPMTDGIQVCPTLAPSSRGFVPSLLLDPNQKLLDAGLYCPKRFPEGPDKYGRLTRRWLEYQVCVSTQTQYVSALPPHGGPYVTITNRDWMLRRDRDSAEGDPGTLYVIDETFRHLIKERGKYECIFKIPCDKIIRSVDVTKDKFVHVPVSVDVYPPPQFSLVFVR